MQSSEEIERLKRRMFDTCVEQEKSGERGSWGVSVRFFGVFFHPAVCTVLFQQKKWNVSIRRLQCMNVNVCVNASCSVRHSEWSEPSESAV